MCRQLKLISLQVLARFLKMLKGNKPFALHLLACSDASTLRSVPIYGSNVTFWASSYRSHPTRVYAPEISTGSYLFKV